MDSYGEILRNARQVKGLDIDTVARETFIISSYIEGLENEDNSAFPGEAYLMGFLKNYSEYLGLDSSQVIILYKNKMLQESPVPQELLAKKERKYLVPLIAGLSVFFVLLVTGIILFIFRKNFFSQETVVNAIDSTTKIYELSDRVFNGRFYKGDQILFPEEKGNIVLTVNDTVGAFVLSTPVGNLFTELSEETELDINGDKISDLVVYVSDLSMTDSRRGAEVRLIKRSGNVSSQVSMSDIPYVTEVENSAKRIVLLEDTRAYPFTLKGTFRGSCVLRYKIDRHESVEYFYTNGEVITMTASNGIRLWMSNGNTVKFSIVADSSNIDLELGKAGKIVAEDIKWIKDSDGKYKLVVIELD